MKVELVGAAAFQPPIYRPKRKGRLESRPSHAKPRHTNVSLIGSEYGVRAPLKHRATGNGVHATIGALFAFLASGSFAFAQSPAPLQSVRFAVFSSRPITDVAFAPLANTPPRKIAFYPTARSPRYEYRGAMPLRFVDATTGKAVAEAIIPPEIHDALLLFAPIETPAAGGLRYRIAVLDDGAARHAPGSLAVINLSGLALSGTVNREDVELKAGLNAGLAVGRSAKIMLRTTFKGRSYQSYAATVQLGRNQRALVILFPPFYAGSLEVQARVLVDEPPGAGDRKK